MTTLRLYETVNAISSKGATGALSERIKVVSGARIVVSIYVNNLVGSVSLVLKDTFSEHVPGKTILSKAITAQGHYKYVVTDFHNIIDASILITGQADVDLGMTSFDNALQSRIDIENAELDVNLNHITQPNGQYDSVRIGDGQDELEINPDGSLPVSVLTKSGLVVFGDALSVPANVETEIVSLSQESFVSGISLGGDNMAEYTIKKNGNVIMREKTFWCEFTKHLRLFDYKLNQGDTLKIFVEHYRPTLGNFYAAILYKL